MALHVAEAVRAVHAETGPRTGLLAAALEYSLAHIFLFGVPSSGGPQQGVAEMGACRGWAGNFGTSRVRRIGMVAASKTAAGSSVGTAGAVEGQSFGSCAGANGLVGDLVCFGRQVRKLVSYPWPCPPCSES